MIILGESDLICKQVKKQGRPINKQNKGKSV